VVEKREATSTLPKASVISTRSMELLRAWGLEGAVRAGAADVEPLGWVTSTLASGEGTFVPLGHPTAAQAAKVSPTRPAWAPQDHLEPILLDYLRSSPLAEVRFGCELVTLQQGNDEDDEDDEDDEGLHERVRAVLLDHGSGRTQEMTFHFVIGADGAHSAVRDALGIGMVGPDDLAEFHNVQFIAPLTAVVADHGHRYGLNLITHPDAAGVLFPDGPQDRWRYTREWRAGQARLVDLPHGQLTHLITTAVGVPDMQIRIERVGAFSFAAQIAEQYRARHGFLIGDAAHRMTPRGGTGMNTAIHDAYDLGWKLGWVLRGWAERSLLDSYEAERRPVGLNNVARSRNPNGAQREYDEAAPWDLNGRLAHHWVEREHRRVSTLDLLGEGLTLLTCGSDPAWAQALSALNAYAPVTLHALVQTASHWACGRSRPRISIEDHSLVICVNGWPARWACHDARGWSKWCGGVTISHPRVSQSRLASDRPAPPNWQPEKSGHSSS
jgi:2-polyprenyl-6-methoxyphenol hydroxylase-like FAD-dependent oxidoreductase